MGTVALGPVYGRVKVSGMTVLEAEKAILKKLSDICEDPMVQVTLAGSTGGNTNYTQPTFYPQPAKRIEPTPAASAPPAARSSGRRQPAPLPQPDTIGIGDKLAIEARDFQLGDAIADWFTIEPMGTVALGPIYGRVKVAEKPILEAEKLITEQLNRVQLAMGAEKSDVKVQVMHEAIHDGRWNTAHLEQVPKIAVGEYIRVNVIASNVREASGGDDRRLVVSPFVNRVFRVEPMGTIALGARYGRVKVVDKTTLESEEAIDKAMKEWAISSGEFDPKDIKVQVTRSFAAAGPQSLQAEHKHEIRIEQTPVVAPAPPEEKAPPEASNNAPLEVGEQVVILIRPVSGGSFVKYPVLTRGGIDPFGFLMIGSQKGLFPDSFRVQIGRKTCEEAAKIIQEEVNKVSANPLMGELVVMREQKYVQASDQFLIEQEQKAEEARANR